MKVIKFFLCFFPCFFSMFFCLSQDFTITVDDVRVETEYALSSKKEPTGYHLYIRKTSDINSVMLTETTKDPQGLESNYAYRAENWNPVNGDEIRMLDGKKLDSQYAKFSIIDSTPEEDEQFGQAFHLYIPTQLVFGYPWTRNGIVQVSLGTFINIRAFGAKYGDYTGGFGDNPFMFDLGSLPEPKAAEATKSEDKVVVVTDAYNPLAAENFADLAENSEGTIIYSKGPDTIIEDIMKSLGEMDSTKPADVVFAIDATGSMKDDIQRLRSGLMERLSSVMQSYNGKMRIGLLLYRDYVDNFRYNGLPVRYFPFTQSLTEFEKVLNSFNIYGTEGGDVPEAVYEALFAAMDFYEWNVGSQKKIILIGDAEPHPKPRGTKLYTKELVESTALARDIKIDAIITPDGKNRGEK